MTTDRNKPTDPPLLRGKRTAPDPNRSLSEDIARKVGMASTADFQAVSPEPESWNSDEDDEDVPERDETATIPAALSRPIPILLHCPLCNRRHIDEGIYKTKPHHTHACQYCGHVWRPAIVATVGVLYLPGFKDH